MDQTVSTNRVIERVQIESAGAPPGFLFDVTSKRLFVAGPMNPEWSETTRLPEGMTLEVFTPAAGRANSSPFASLAAGSPSAVTFHKRVTPGTRLVQYLIAVRHGGVYLPPAAIVELDSARGRFANVTFESAEQTINIHFDIAQ